jgi:Domain of unknown function (DUF5655)
MAERQCYHCKQWIAEGEAHDCWTTTETALTADLSEDLRDAWERLREAAGEFGEQRIYASHSSIMFSRKACYFFVRPKKSFLEVCIFLGRPIKSPQVRRADRVSKSKVAHMIRVTHRDEVEAPLTDWLKEAYESSDILKGKARTTAPKKVVKKAAKKSARKAPRKTAKKAAPAPIKSVRPRSRRTSKS